MGTKEKYEKEQYEEAYARGREDGKKSGESEVDPVKVGAGVMTAGVSLPFTGITSKNYNPPTNAKEKEAYDRGWNDEKEACHVEK